MVDLVKIRKKAKERSGAGARGSDERPAEKVEVGVRKSEEATAEPKRPEEPASSTQKISQPLDEKRTVSKDASVPPPAEAAANADSNSGTLQWKADRPSVTAAALQPPAADLPAPELRAPAPDPPVKSTKLDRFKEQAGRRREDADSVGRSAAAESVVDERHEVLTFAIAGEHYAMDIEHIVEIVPPRAATRVPNSSESIVGIMSLRGTIVTLIDVRHRLTHKAIEPSADSRIVVLEHGGETIGFEVDRVFRVIKIAASDVAPHPVVHASEADESIRGVFRHGDSLTILLDFAKLLGSRGPVSVFRGRSAGMRAPKS